MTWSSVFQIGIFFIVILLLIKPLGTYIFYVYSEKPDGLRRVLSPIEHFIYKISGINPKEEMTWKTYLFMMLLVNCLGIILLYAIQRVQIFLPLNPEHFSNVKPIIAFNTAVSFVTNTDWQSYAGENSLSYFTQMLGLTTQNFLSAASGMALLIAFIRGFILHESNTLGNFWVDLVRGILYILLPLAVIFSIFLVSQGVIQNFNDYQKCNLMQVIHYEHHRNDDTGNSLRDSKGNFILENKKTNEQILPMGPVASQVAIAQLGSNGGGFFNVSSAHPFANPNPLTNFFEMIAILLIPAALTYTFGKMIHDKRQGWSLFIAMLLMFIPLLTIDTIVEQKGNPVLTAMGINQLSETNISPGGNMEGKELRFGIINSTLWTTLTTTTSNGSVNSMLDSYTPLGGLIPLWLMHVGEVIFGGVGSGLYGMLLLVIITVFVAGLMVGRTPEYLGKKIEPYEMKMASFGVLLMPMIVLLFTALASITEGGRAGLTNTGSHGFTEMLYAFTSMGNNNGSAFSGIKADTPFYALLGGIEMLFVRFWIAIPTLAIAGSLAKKKRIPVSLGTLPTHTPFFIIMLIGVIFLLGALTFFPTLALGPIVEQLTMWKTYGY